MKSSLLLSAVLCPALSFGQATSTPPPGNPATTQAPSSTTTPTPSSPSMRVRGPEAVARQDPGRVVATIDGKQITAKQAAGMLQAIPPEQLKRYQSNLSSVVQQIYMSQQLAEQAAKMNLDQQSPWKEQLQLTRDNILTQAYLNKMASVTPGTPTEDPQAYYNSHQPEFDRVKLSGIFVAYNPPGTPASSAANNRTEEQAKAKADDIEKKLKAGGEFATLARTESDNQQAASRGGELGAFSVADPQLPADLRTALNTLKPGQISDPVRIPNALLIVKMESHDKLSFDQAKAEIAQKLQNERNQAAVKHEVEKYKIQVQDPDFFNTSSAPASNIPSLQRPATPSPQTSAPPAKP